MTRNAHTTVLPQRVQPFTMLSPTCAFRAHIPRMLMLHGRAQMLLSVMRMMTTSQAGGQLALAQAEAAAQAVPEAKDVAALAKTDTL